jgi:hypothetical protein
VSRASRESSSSDGQRSVKRYSSDTQIRKNSGSVAPDPAVRLDSEKASHVRQSSWQLQGDDASGSDGGESTGPSDMKRLSKAYAEDSHYEGDTDDTSLSPGGSADGDVNTRGRKRTRGRRSDNGGIIMD